MTEAARRRPRRARPLDARLGAAELLLAVGEGRSLTQAAGTILARVNPIDRGFAQELAYGTLRWHPRLQAISERLLDKPLGRRGAGVQALLLIALYQLSQGVGAAHAAVHAAVEAARAGGWPWAAGLLNAVLRRYQREQATIDAGLAQDPVAHNAHPAWWWQRLRGDWGEAAAAICAADNQHAPLTLRLNLGRTPLTVQRQRLQDAGLHTEAVPGLAAALILDPPCPVERIPGFRDGEVSVQDAAAQLAAGLLAPAPGDRVLDACAAPGGKTGHLLELHPGLDLLALDSDPQRLQRVADNLQRLGLQAGLCAADAARPDSWWDGRPFQRILLDAPCSGSGVVRRHPDMKLLRRPGDLDALCAGQARLLDALFPLLAPGGRLLYATCSVFRAENDGQLAGWLAHHPEARERPIQADWGRAMPIGRQILPGEQGMDGFYYACLERSAPTG